MKECFDVLVIGAGPAGMMAAGRAAECGKSVCIIEKNRLVGRKLRITGKGRCNITNAKDVGDYFENIPTNPKFLYSALYGFTGYDAMAFFEKWGVPCKVERGDRVFPVSDRAADVAEALLRYVNAGKCRLLQGRVKKILTENGRVSGVVYEKGTVFCKSVVVATGGMSYPLTGSVGDGYKLSQMLGHTIIPPKAALVPMTSEDACCQALQGLTLKNVAVSMQSPDGKVLGEEFGEMLFAHFGVTGPVILSLSSVAPKAGKWIISIDLKPALSKEQLDARLLRDFSKNLNKQLGNAMFELLPKKLIPEVLQKAKLSPQKVIHDLSKTERIQLLETLKSFQLECSGLRPIEEAIVTSGGVCVKEINPSTMESKLLPGLFFAGEVIDVDAYTGGFNLQIAYATGRLAGENV